MYTHSKPDIIIDDIVLDELSTIEGIIVYVLLMLLVDDIMYTFNEEVGDIVRNSAKIKKCKNDKQI